MANVDKCTRCAEAGLCGDAKNQALKIAKIDDKLRNRIFRGKDANQIEKMLTDFAKKVKKVVSRRFGFECKKLFASSNNNKDGADLYTIRPSGEKIIIEIKFGSYTDKAAGMKSFSKIFGTKIFSDTLSTTKRKEWQNKIKDEYPDFSKQSQRVVDTLNGAASDFNKLMAKNHHVLSKDLQEFMEDYLLNNSGSYDSHTDSYIRFEVNGDGTDIDDVALLQKGRGTWHVKDIALLDPANEDARINVFIYNDETNLQVKFVLNNKNDLTLKNSSIKVRSKYMVNSPSWNVWIREKKLANKST